MLLTTCAGTVPDERPISNHLLAVIVLHEDSSRTDSSWLDKEGDVLGGNCQIATRYSDKTSRSHALNIFSSGSGPANL